MLDKFYQSWKLKINPQKTGAIFFTRRRVSRAFPRTNLILDNQQITWLNEVKYLGVTLDSKLTFKQHIDKTITKSGKIISFLNRQSRLNQANKIFLYKSIFQPILLYGSAIWGNCASCHLHRLQRTQNRILKICLNKNWRYSTMRLHNEAFVQTISNKIATIQLRFSDRCNQSNNPLITELI